LDGDAAISIQRFNLAFNALPSADQEGDTDEIVATLIEKGFWTVANLTACFRALTAEGLLTVAAGGTRNLSSAERLKVTRLAQAGNIDAAISEYLKCSLDGEEPDMDMLNDPAYSDACNNAVYAVFLDSQFDFAETAERRSYLLRYSGSRPLTLALLQQGWAACKANELRHDHSEALRPLRQRETQAPTQPELDELDDSQVDSLYHASLRQYANDIRRPGVAAQ
jgi:hypothetical protein